LLSSRFSLSLFASAGALLLAGSVSALTLNYNVSGTMDMTNTGSCTPATCNVAVTGTMTIDDDEVGNVSITSMNLSHANYEVGSPPLISIQLARSSITLSGSVLGAGTTLSGATSFGSQTINQVGTLTCTPGFFTCVVAGLPAAGGVFPLGPNPDPSPTAFGTFNFDAGRNFSTPLLTPITYTNTVTPSAALERLSLNGTLIPEPGTGLLMAVGLMGMAVRRRAER